MRHAFESGDAVAEGDVDQGRSDYQRQLGGHEAVHFEEGSAE